MMKSERSQCLDSGIELKKEVTVKEAHKVFEQASHTTTKDKLWYTGNGVVTVEFIGNEYLNGLIENQKNGG